MSAIPVRKLSESEYLEIERSAEFKSEFFDGVMYPMQPPPGAVGMAGAMYAHNRVKENLARALGNILDDTGPCQTLSSDMRIKVRATGLLTYPDVVVACGDLEFEDADRPETILNPTVIVEVLSESTERYDRGRKFENYKRIETLREYVLVAPDRVLVERFVRQPSGDWLLTEFADPGGSFALATLPVEIPMTTVYRRVTLPENPPLR
jgi:Uma2 family endonuclease